MGYSKLIQPNWNRIVRKEYPPKVRDYIRASDIGKPYIDRYYSMLGTEVTNPFEERVLRIFDAGKVMEFIVLRALTNAGLLNRKQSWVEYPASKDNLRIVGYLDATIGGYTDWGHAEQLMLDHLAEYKLDLDDQVIEQKAMQIIEGLREAYPSGWSEEMLVEVKSINSLSFWAHKNRDEEGNFLGYEHNKLQLYAYLKATKLRQGILLYISKDDFSLEELPVMNGDYELENKFQEDIHTITKYYREKVVPPKEPEIVYNDRKGTFETNWNVGRSPYLALIYGYENQDVYQKAWHKELLDINRALRHLRKGKTKADDLLTIDKYNLAQYMDLVPEEDTEELVEE